MPDVIDLSEIGSDGDESLNQDDVVITDVREVPPERRAAGGGLRSAGVTIYLPDGPHVVPSVVRPPERVSFEGGVGAPSPANNINRTPTPGAPGGRHGPVMGRAEEPRWRIYLRTGRRASTRANSSVNRRGRGSGDPESSSAPDRWYHIVPDSVDRHGRDGEYNIPFDIVGSHRHERRFWQDTMGYAFDEDGEQGDVDGEYHIRPRRGYNTPGIWDLPFGPNRNDDVPQELMDMIHQREEAHFDRVRQANLNSTQSYQQAIEDRIKSIREPYTTRIEPEEEYVCCLCAVTLGEGLPSEFIGNKEKRPLVALQEVDDVRAPFKAMNLVTDADRDLSKRIFIAKCGHTYCGRCVNSISRVRATLKTMKRKFKRTDNDIDNPFICAPGKCVAPDCSKAITGKTAFIEMFL